MSAALARNPRALKILAALQEGELSFAQLKTQLRDQALDRGLCRTMTWNALCLLADLELVVMAAGKARSTDAGDAVLAAAEAKARGAA